MNVSRGAKITVRDIKKLNAMLKKKGAAPIPVSEESDIPPWVWKANGCDVPEKEYRFSKKRKWRIDYAYPELKLAIEIEGGRYSRGVVCHNCRSTVMQKTKNGKMMPVKIGGRHNTSGFERDIEKYNELSERGWLLLRYLPKKVNFEQVSAICKVLKKSAAVQWV